MDTSFFGINLPKWAGILILGEPVTPEQAKQIIHATTPSLYDDMRYAGNSFEFQKAYDRKSFSILMDMGYSQHMEGSAELSDTQAKIRKFVCGLDDQLSPVLPLEFLKGNLGNSCYFGGPTGWCNPSGEISLLGINIGKYPSVREIFTEWSLIAKKFDFLDLTCVILDNEWCDETASGRVGFRVKSGEVSMFIPCEGEVDTLASGIADKSIQSKPMYDYSELEEYLGVKITYKHELGLPVEFYLEAIQKRRELIVTSIRDSFGVSEEELIEYIASM